MRNFNLSPSALRSRLRQSALHRLRISSGGLLTINKINDTFRVKAGGLTVAMFIRMLPAVGLRITTAKCRSILIFLATCRKIHSAQGMPGLVKWLKASSVLLQQAIAGHKLDDPGTVGPRVARTKSGLPRLILAQDRALCRAGRPEIIKFYLTLLNLYRVLEFKGKLKLSTITDGPKIPTDSRLVTIREFVYSKATMAAFVKALSGLTKINPRELLFTQTASPFAIIKSGPGTVGESGAHSISTKPIILMQQAKALFLAGLGDHLAQLMKWLGRGHPILTGKLVQLFTQLAMFQTPLKLPSFTVRSIGKLGLKEEPAGKVRVFAMVTAWDHWALKPLHDTIFEILKYIPQDGTHNQLGPLDRLFNCKSLWSLDLTAATDRLPLSLQRPLLEVLFNDRMEMLGQLWGDLLVGRGYVISSMKYHVDKIIQYKTGQPMGALSSWASLAITHHFLVQCAAWHSGVVPLGVWFSDYAIVGDDVVIGDPRVKDSYLLILAALGMPVNINKSILSPVGTGMEFCKRTFFKGIDVSPVPVKEFIDANLTLSGAIAFMHKYHLTLPELLRSLGYGYKVLGSLGKHVGQLNARVRALLFASLLPSVEGSPDSVPKVGTHLQLGQARLDEQQQKEVLFIFLLSIKSLVSLHLHKIERVRLNLDELITREVSSVRAKFLHVFLKPYLIEQAHTFHQGKAILGFEGPVSTETGPHPGFSFEKMPEPLALGDTDKAGLIPMTQLNVPIEIQMGFRDLLASAEGPIGELLEMILQDAMTRRRDLMKDLKLKLKAFKPNMEDLTAGFMAAVDILKVLNELMDINPVMDRRLSVIPKSHGHHINEQLWHLYTMVINGLDQGVILERGQKVTGIPINAMAKAIATKFFSRKVK